jgi:hypothetical protein
VAAELLVGCESVVVSSVEISEVQVIPASMTLLEGRTQAASAIVTATGGEVLPSLDVAWTVDHPDIATITAEGVVHGLEQGATHIRAVSEGVTGIAEVMVLRDPSTPDVPNDGDDDDDGDPSCEISDQLFVRDVEIRPNASCTFTDVRVRGNVLLREGARLVASRLTVDGSIEANRAAGLVLTDSWIYGEVKFEEGGTVTIAGTLVDGKVELKSNLGVIDAADNRIEEAFKLEKNRGGPFRLLRNESRNLECKENTPEPSGSGNVVREDRKAEQCEDLLRPLI